VPFTHRVGPTRASNRGRILARQPDHEGVVVARAGAPETAGCGAGDVDVARGVHRHTVSVVVVAGAELPGPEGAAGRVVLGHERVVVARAGAPQVAGCKAGDVDVARGIHRHTARPVIAAGAELPDPEGVAGGVVLGHERVVVARAGASQAAVRGAGDV